MKSVSVGLFVAASVILTGCLPANMPVQQQRSQSVQIGQSQSLTPIRIVKVRALEHVTRGGVGQTIGTVGGGTAGAVAGGMLGKQVGGGTGKTIATVAGAVMGGIAGSHYGGQLGGEDKALATEYVYEIDNRWNSGQVQTLVLDGPPQFSVGDLAYLAPGGYNRPARLIPR